MFLHDINPVMFHQANLREFAQDRSLFSDVMMATFETYKKYCNLTVISLTQDKIGEYIKAREAWQRTNVNAVYDLAAGTITF